MRSNAIPSVAGDPHALVVESDRDQRELYGAILQPLIHQVEYADDGAVAYARAITWPPALVVTETRVPRIEGITLTRWLRAAPATRHAGILVVPSSGLPELL